LYLIVISQRSTLAEQVSFSRDDLIPPVQAIYRTSTGRNIERAVSKPKAHNIVKDTNVHKNTKQSDEGRSGRILDILRMGGELGIKDIATNLPQYSEKMIQRELAELVESKLVLKVGEKRWSRYRVSA
jgi:hypothetical protein